MDKFEYQAKLEEIGKLVDSGDLEEAVKIADTIEWKRVRSVRTLCTVSEIYEEVGRVEDSKAILSRAYRRSPNSRQLLYRLSEACVLTKDFDEAVEYYTEYVNLSPNDSNKYVLKYKIYKGRGSSIEEQIKVLEDLKSAEYSERWAYELACLYEEAGMIDQCVNACDDLALWFRNGKYVVQALKLKQKYASLTPEQQTICDNPSDIIDMETKEEVIGKAVPKLNTEIEKELPVSEADAIADSILMSTEKEIAAAVAEHKAAEAAQAVAGEGAVKQEEILREQGASEAAEKASEEKVSEEKVSVKETEEEPEEVQDKKYDALKLQAELAHNVKQMFAGFKLNRKPEAVEKVVEVVPEEETYLEPKKAVDPREETIDEILARLEAAGELIKEPEEEKEETSVEEPEEKALELTEEVEAPAEGFTDEAADRVAEEDIPEEAAEEMTEEPEEAPVQETVKAEKAPVLTADEVLTAATINLGESIRKEIGEASLREYAAAKAAKKAEEEKLTRKIILDEVPVITEDPVLEVPEIPEIKIPTLEMPEMNLRKEPAVKEKAVVKPIEEPTEEPIKEPVEEPAEEPVVEEAVLEQKKEEAALEEAEAIVEELEMPDAFKIDPMSYTRDGLDEREKSMLGFWHGIRGIDEQVDQAVTQIMRSALKDKTSSSGNVILVGNAGNGRTTLAISVAKIVCRCKGQQNAKVAKIYAEDLNNRDIAQVVSKISGGVLIIEEAGDLSDNAIAQLSMAMDFKTDSLVIFLEDERRYLQELLARNPKFAQKFDITMSVPILTNDELVQFANYYAMQNDCILSEAAIIALYDGIGTMQNPEQPVAILDVKEVMDKAMKRANKFSLGKLLATVTGKRFDEDNRVIIEAKAFKEMNK